MWFFRGMIAGALRSSCHATSMANPFDTVARMVLDGEIVDSMTVVAVLLAARRREKRRGQRRRWRRGPRDMTSGVA